MAVTAGNASIAALADELNGVKTEITFIRQDMQKIRDRASALEGRVSSVEDDIIPFQ